MKTGVGYQIDISVLVWYGQKCVGQEGGFRSSECGATRRCPVEGIVKYPLFVKECSTLDVPPELGVAAL